MASRSKANEQLAGDAKFAVVGVPRYYQLATLLRHKIVTGAYEVGGKIPSETDLVSDYGLSRTTVRQALASLEEEGLIRREPGRGTFVNEVAESFGGDLELDRSIDDLISMGQATSVELLELEEVSATPEEARDLQIDAGSAVIRCKRIRHFEGEPYCYIVNHLPAEIGRRIAEPHWRQGSVLRFIERELRIPLRIAEQRLRATLADSALAQSLQVRVGEPLLLVDYHIRTDDDRPVEMAELYYRSDLYSFTLRLSRSGGGEARDAWSLKENRFEH